MVTIVDGAAATLSLQGMKTACARVTLTSSAKADLGGAATAFAANEVDRLDQA
jgi:hypothetical protein